MPAQHHGDAEQRCRDRPVNEGRRDVHGAAVGERVSERRWGPARGVSPVVAAGVSARLVPRWRRQPAATTVSPRPRFRRSAAFPAPARRPGRPAFDRLGDRRAGYRPLRRRSLPAGRSRFSGVPMAMRVPSFSWANPVVTTRSPAAMPDDQHRLGIVLLGHRHRPHRDRVVVIGDVDEGAVRPALDGGGRHHDGVLERVDQELHIDELARPQLQGLHWEIPP